MSEDIAGVGAEVRVVLDENTAVLHDESRVSDKLATLNGAAAEIATRLLDVYGEVETLRRVTAGVVGELAVCTQRSETAGARLEAVLSGVTAAADASWAMTAA